MGTIRSDCKFDLTTGNTFHQKLLVIDNTFHQKLLVTGNSLMFLRFILGGLQIRGFDTVGLQIRPNGAFQHLLPSGIQHLARQDQLAA